MPGARWTTGAEIAAYLIAHVIGLVLAFGAGAMMGALGFYQYVMQHFGVGFVPIIGLVQGVVIIAIVLLIFLGLRMGMMGGLPPAGRAG